MKCREINVEEEEEKNEVKEEEYWKVEKVQEGEENDDDEEGRKRGMRTNLRKWRGVKYHKAPRSSTQRNSEIRDDFSGRSICVVLK